MKQELTSLDLFSGIGGFALASEWAGIRTMGFAEINPYAASELKKNFPGVPNLGDVTKLCRRLYDCEPIDPETGEANCPRCGVEFGECDCIGTDQFTDTYGFPDVIVGGVPCQPASLVGKRRGAADERWLWPDTLRIIGELQPRFAILENPEAILSLDGGERFRDILGTLASLGYDVQWHVIPAAALGAGHRRKRVWILASDADSAGLSRHAGHEQDGHKSRRKLTDSLRHSAAPDLRAREITGPLWYHQSGIQPVVDGLPRGLAVEQITAIGNSLVPQLAHVWLRAIAQIERGETA